MATNNWNDGIIEEFRANGGVVGHGFGDALILLHTTGAKSGKERVNPVAHVIEGGSYIVIASKGGAPDNPDWYHNLRANPDVTIETGNTSFPATAEVLSGAERQRLWDAMVAKRPGFADYESKTNRQIPVVRLTPAGTPS